MDVRRPGRHRGRRLRDGRFSGRSMQAMFGNQFLFWGLVLGELGLVFYLSARVDKIAPTTASVLFLLYSALNGLTLSIILLAFTGTSIATTFAVTAGMFGALALFGTTTKRSLAGVGQFVFMGLIGLVLASIVGIFWQEQHASSSSSRSSASSSSRA